MASQQARLKNIKEAGHYRMILESVKCSVLFVIVKMVGTEKMKTVNRFPSVPSGCPAVNEHIGPARWNFYKGIYNENYGYYAVKKGNLQWKYDEKNWNLLWKFYKGIYDENWLAQWMTTMDILQGSPRYVERVRRKAHDRRLDGNREWWRLGWMSALV